MPENISGCMFFVLFFLLLFIYRRDSLNDETRQKIVTDVYRKVIGNCRCPKSWNTFIRCDENKSEIFGLLVVKFILAQNYAQVIVTKMNGIVCNVEIKFFKLSEGKHNGIDLILMIFILQ